MKAYYIKLANGSEMTVLTHNRAELEQSIIDRFQCEAVEIWEL